VDDLLNTDVAGLVLGLLGVTPGSEVFATVGHIPPGAWGSVVGGLRRSLWRTVALAGAGSVAGLGGGGGV